VFESRSGHLKFCSKHFFTTLANFILFYLNLILSIDVYDLVINFKLSYIS
jgi:hypothetical protein